LPDLDAVSVRRRFWAKTEKLYGPGRFAVRNALIGREGRARRRIMVPMHVHLRREDASVGSRQTIWNYPNYVIQTEELLTSGIGMRFVRVWFKFKKYKIKKKQFCYLSSVWETLVICKSALTRFQRNIRFQAKHKDRDQGTVDVEKG
jgi:hypothetical protein